MSSFPFFVMMDPVVSCVDPSGASAGMVASVVGVAGHSVSEETAWSWSPSCLSGVVVLLVLAMWSEVCRDVWNIDR